MGLDLRRRRIGVSKNIPKIISLLLLTAITFYLILKLIMFPIAMHRFLRIINWIIVILCSALILYIVITEERFAPEGWGFDNTEQLISEAQAELEKKPLK